MDMIRPAIHTAKRPMRKTQTSRIVLSTTRRWDGDKFRAGADIAFAAATDRVGSGGRIS
jgi:hypothetical protein